MTGFRAISKNDAHLHLTYRHTSAHIRLPSHIYRLLSILVHPTSTHHENPFSLDPATHLTKINTFQ
ncbi:hypothetical protein [uncultured Gimesia sp.]|uniref:hypothetical protein n=1 Tax=uncultured Gimesia sp. TaxID=1678688 RepID=UPI0030DA94E6